MSLDELLAKIDTVFTKDMPFMKQFSAKTEHFDTQNVRLQFTMSECLIGNTMSKILHGGAISSMLDTVGGMLTMAAVFNKHLEDPVEKQMQRVARTSTVNLMINFLRPGSGNPGDYFIAEANLVRCGSRITVCELALKNQKDVVLATGTGTYMNGVLA